MERWLGQPYLLVPQDEINTKKTIAITGAKRLMVDKSSIRKKL